MPRVPQSAAASSRAGIARRARRQRGGLGVSGARALADVGRSAPVARRVGARGRHGAQARLASGRSSQCVTVEGSTTIMRPSSRPSPMARYCGYFASEQVDAARELVAPREQTRLRPG